MTELLNLGDKVKCKITGYEGLLTSRIEHINGCWRYGIQGRIDKDGKVPDCVWVDAPQTELIEANVLARTSPNTGGPLSSTPKREATP